MAERAELTCPNCGAKLHPAGDADQAVCPRCRTELLLEGKAVAGPPEAEPPPCPLCGKADRIQKVSSTYVAEISRGYRGGLWGPPQTELSRLLSPPSRPPSTDLPALFRFNLGTMLCGLTLLTAICLYTGVPLVVFPSEVTLMGISFGATPGLVCSAVILAASFSAGAVLFYSGYKRMRSWQERLPLEKGRWKRATGRWERLYYCARDDGVYIPGQTTVIPILEIDKIVHPP